MRDRAGLVWGLVGCDLDTDMPEFVGTTQWNLHDYTELSVVENQKLFLNLIHFLTDLKFYSVNKKVSELP